MTQAAAPIVSASGPQVRPWVRFWARQIDSSIATIALAFLCGIFAPELAESNGIAFTFVALFGWIFVEAWALSTWCATPGKWLLRVSVHPADGRFASYSTALRRSFLVWWRGLGAGLPLVSLVACSIADRTLRMRRRTTWDRDTGLETIHRRIGPLRALAAIAYGAGCLWLIALSRA